MAVFRTKFFQNPTYKKAEWEAKNPFLSNGQIGFQINDAMNTIEGFKVGPGNWNDLPFLGDTTYPYTDLVTNEIGDVKLGTSRFGDPLADIIRDMISPFVVPTISNAQNSAGGSLANDWILEIGNTLSGPVTVSFTVTADSNLRATDPIQITAGGKFTNEGFFPNAPAQLILPAPLAPTTVDETTIDVTGFDVNDNQTNVAKTFFRFYPQIFWGISSQEDLTPAEAGTIPFKQQRLAKVYQGDYEFNAAGYLWWFVPTMLNPTNVQFFDVSPDALPGATIGMVDKGILNINNGTTTYDYQAYRSTFLIQSNLTIINVQ